MKEILYVLLNNFADHEVAFLTQAINTDQQGLPRKEPKYINKIVSSSLEPVKSIGGFRVVPDYTFNTIPKDYAALILIGGSGWQTSIADELIPIIKDALDKNIIIGAICMASSWMAKQGFLNNIKHTGNGLKQLKEIGGKNYTNENGYINEQAVSDGNIVTANGSAYLEFTCELLKLLKNDTPEIINNYYYFYKKGFVEMTSNFS